MKKIISILITISCLFLCAIPMSAANLADWGYYLSNVYVQNKGGIFYNGVVTAASNWNNASSQRKVVINTVSSNSVYDDDWSRPPLNAAPDKFGAYDVIIQGSYACTCHKTTSFNIFINKNIVTSSTMASVIAHELGHAFGLNDDHSSSLRLMSGSRNRTSVVAPIADEVSSMQNYWNDNHN